MFPTSRFFSSRRSVDAATQRMFLVATALLAVSVGVWAVSLSGDSLLAGQFTNNAFRSCVDSDETNNFKSFTDASASLFTAGAAKVTFKDKSETKLVDFCITETTLNEYGCFGTIPGSVAVQCENGCSEGACIAGPPKPKPTTPSHFLKITNVTNDSGKIRLQYQTFGGGTAIDVLLWKVSATAPGPDTFVQTPCGYSSRACSGTPATCNLKTDCAYPTDFSNFRYAVNATVRGRPALTDIKEIVSPVPTPTPTPDSPALIITKIENNGGKLTVYHIAHAVGDVNITLRRVRIGGIEIQRCQSVSGAGSGAAGQWYYSSVTNTNCSYPILESNTRYFVDLTSDFNPQISNTTEFFPPILPVNQSVRLTAYLQDSLSVIRPTITSEHLPTLLTPGNVSDVQGTFYSYQQHINLGDRNITFSNSNSDLLNPTVLIDAGARSDNPLYNIIVTFAKPINISGPATTIGFNSIPSVQGKYIELFGKNYSISFTSTARKLVLSDASDLTMLAISDGERILSTNGSSHTVRVVDISGSDAVLEIDGVSEIFSKGEAKTVSGSKGNVEVNVHNVYWFSQMVAHNRSSVSLSLGARKLTFEDGRRVMFGAQDVPIDGTLAKLTGNPLSQLTVSVAAARSLFDHISNSSPFTDPVFGTFRITLNEENPPLTDGSRSRITINTDGSRVGYVSIENYYRVRKINMSFDADQTGSSVTPRLADEFGMPIHVMEGETVSVMHNVIFPKGGNSRLFRFTDAFDINDSTAADGTVVLTDVLTNMVFRILLQPPFYNTANFYVDGQEYFVNASGSGMQAQATFTWGDGASIGNYGTVRTVFPQISASDVNTDSIALLTNQNIPVGTTIELPGGREGGLYSYPTTVATVTNSGTGTQKITAGRLEYYLNFTSNNMAVINYVCGVGQPLGRCLHLSDGYPGVLLIEEHGKNYFVRDAVLAEFTSSGTTSVRMGVSTTAYLTDTSGAASFTSFSSNTNKQAAVDQYGTYVETDSTGSGRVDILYPANPMEITFFVKAS